MLGRGRVLDILLSGEVVYLKHKMREMCQRAFTEESRDTHLLQDRTRPSGL